MNIRDNQMAKYVETYFLFGSMETEMIITGEIHALTRGGRQSHCLGGQGGGFSGRRSGSDAKIQQEG